MRKENIWLATLGIILFLIGLMVSFYREEVGVIGVGRKVFFPHQGLGLVLVLAGIGLTAISLYTSLRTTT